MKKFGCNQVDWAVSRRDFLTKTGAGFGAVALSSLLAEQSVRGASAVAAMEPKLAHYAARAKSVIFLFMEGGPSHLDTFDPKAALREQAGKPLPPGFTKGLITAMGEYNSPIFPDQRQWKQWGQSGLWISDAFPKVAAHADELCLLRGMHTDIPNHPQAFVQTFMGVAPMKMKWLYRRLRKNALKYGGVVVFFDEADVLGNRGGLPDDFQRMEAFEDLRWLSPSGREAVMRTLTPVSKSDEPEPKRGRIRRIIMPGMGGGGMGGFGGWGGVGGTGSSRGAYGAAGAGGDGGAADQQQNRNQSGA